MKRLLLFMLLSTACKTKELERHGKLIIVRESLNAWYDWEHTDHLIHLECAGFFGKRVATGIRAQSSSTTYVSYVDGDTLFLADTKDCSTMALLTDARMNVDMVQWSGTGNFGFKALLGDDVTGAIDGTRGASASFIIHATRPPKMEPLDDHAWLAVGSSLFGKPAWSGDVLLLARHLPGNHYEVATWSPGERLHVFPFKSPEGDRFPTHAWNGTTPLIETPDGFVELR